MLCNVNITQGGAILFSRGPLGNLKARCPPLSGTSKRPVPLEHSLYYGGEMLLINSGEQYKPEGYRSANLLYKKKNEVPETRKDEKAARPTGRCGRE